MKPKDSLICSLTHQSGEQALLLQQGNGYYWKSLETSDESVLFRTKHDAEEDFLKGVRHVV